MDTTYSIDGTSLDDQGGRWWLERDDPFQATPAVRSASIQVPGRDGIVPQFNEMYESRTLALKLIVTDRDRFGTARGYDQLVANMHLLLGLANVRYRLVRLTRTMGGQALQAEGRSTVSVDPEMLDSRTARVTLVFELTDPFWKDQRTSTITSPVLDDNESWQTDSTAFGGGNAPIRDAEFGAGGQLSGIRLTDVASGRWINLITTSGPSQGLYVDCASMRAWRTATTDPFDLDGATEVSGNLDTGPGGFALEPTIPAGQSRSVVSLRVRREGTSGTIQVRARRAWL